MQFARRLLKRRDFVIAPDAMAPSFDPVLLLSLFVPVAFVLVFCCPQLTEEEQIFEIMFATDPDAPNQGPVYYVSTSTCLRGRRNIGGE